LGGATISEAHLRSARQLLAESGQGYPDSARLRVISTMDVLRGNSISDFGFSPYVLFSVKALQLGAKS
jgi:hypothetical protein